MGRHTRRLLAVALAAALVAGAAAGGLAAARPAVAKPPARLTWRSVPAPWSLGQAACWLTFGEAPGRLALANGDVVVPASVPLGASRTPHCGAAVLSPRAVRVVALKPGEYVIAASALTGGRFVLGTVIERGEYGGPVLGGRLLVSSGTRWRTLPLPSGQVVQSVAALPDGGFAVGTGQGPCVGHCPPVCAGGRGRVGVVSAADQARWFVPPRPRPGGSVGMGDAPWEDPCGVVAGVEQGGRLWFAVNGAGVAYVDSATGRFAPGPGARDGPYLGGEGHAGAAGGPVRFLAATAAAVYFDVARLPFVADAGYWGPLQAASVERDGTIRLRAYLPAETGSGSQRGVGCIQGGVGAPRWADVEGGRLWVVWAACPVYEAPTGAAALARPAAGCHQDWSGAATTGFPVAFLGSGEVAEACGSPTDPRFYVFAGRTGAVVRRFGWPPALRARGIAPDGAIQMYAAGRGNVWVVAAMRGGGPDQVVELTPAGAIVQRIAVPGATSVVGARGGLWLMGPRRVAELAA